MSAEYDAVANGLIMWLACTPGILWVCFQAVLFLRKSVKDGMKMGLTQTQIKRGIRGASIASVGPCVVILSSMLSLMVIVGGPLAWLRIDVIGGVGYEIMGATFAANAMGITPGTEEMTVDYLCVASVVMTTGCLGWIIFAALFSDKMEKVNNFMAGGNKALIPIISAGCVLGCYSNLVVEQVAPLGDETVATLASAVSMIGLLLLSKTLKKRWIKDWVLSIAMLLGMMLVIILP